MTPSLQAVRALNNARLARILAGAPSLTEEEQAEIVEREIYAGEPLSERHDNLKKYHAQLCADYEKLRCMWLEARAACREKS